jgi:hypothetical protein
MADFNQDFYQGGNYSQGQMGWSNQYQQDQPVYNQQSQYTMMPSQNYSQQYYTDQSYEGEGMEVGPPQGSMGQMSSTSGGYMYDNSNSTGFEDEPPLLEELGIDFHLIKENTLSVLNPLQQADANVIRNTDLTGPLLFCLLFGGILLLSGKVHFGYIYGVGLLGCIGMYLLLNLMSMEGVPASIIVSVLGYCLLPIVLLSCVSVVISLQGALGMALAVGSIAWCSYSSSKLFVSVLDMTSQQLLVAYPCALLYGVFVLLTVF